MLDAKAMNSYDLNRKRGGRDNQKTRCYNFEHSHLYWRPFASDLTYQANRNFVEEAREVRKRKLYCPKLNQEQSEYFIRTLVQSFGIDLSTYSIKVAKDGDRRATRARAGWYSIHIPNWARFPAIMLHEVSHTIDYRLPGDTGQGHGPRFMRIFLELWDHVIGYADPYWYGTETAVGWARDYGLKVTHGKLLDLDNVPQLEELLG